MNNTKSAFINFIITMILFLLCITSGCSAHDDAICSQHNEETNFAPIKDKDGRTYRTNLPSDYHMAYRDSYFKLLYLRCYEEHIEYYYNDYISVVLDCSNLSSEEWNSVVDELRNGIGHGGIEVTLQITDVNNGYDRFFAGALSYIVDDENKRFYYHLCLPRNIHSLSGAELYLTIERYAKLELNTGTTGIELFEFAPFIVPEKVASAKKMSTVERKIFEEKF